ncbi:MAG: NAD-dependent epimerase/dehydratase family protein [Alphaproteobacteria bacterium]|nr:NAD-dependent epimerase/dehydratase family protein [Alphaproteobacteria bacterium]
MKVLVTGATGFVGANLVRRLLERGDEVRCLVRKPNALVEGLDVELLTVPMVPRDRQDQEDLVRALDGCDGIYHVAGVYDAGPSGRQTMRDVHVFGTRALCEAAVSAGVRRMVLCSSSVTVGYGPIDHPGDEDTPLDPTPVYGATGSLRWYYDTKIQSERLATGWGGVEVVVVNPDFVLGAWDVKPTSGSIIVQMAKHPVPFYPQGGKCFIHAMDVADGHIGAMEQGVPGRRYLLGNHNLSYHAFMDVVADVVGCRRPVVSLPAGVLHAAASVGGLLRMTDPHRFAGMSRPVLLSMQEERYRSGQRARDELGMPSTPVEQAVEDAFRWFRDHGYC